MSISGPSPVEEVWNPDADDPIDPASDECKYAVADKAPFTAASKYWREYARTCKIVASHPEGVFLTTLLRELHGEPAPESGSTEYQRTRRFMSRNPEIFEVRKENGLVFATPTLAALDLINGGIIQRPEESPSNGDSSFCADLLKTVKTVNDKGERLLEYNLREYVERINDLRLILHSEEADPSYVSLPYKTRFNDTGRIDKQWSILSSTIEKSGDWYDNACLLTLTTDPKKFDSIYQMWDEINSNWNRLMSWLSSDAHLGYRPEYVKVLEATEQGFPHIHAIVFLEDESTRSDGMPWLESKDAVSDYWAKYQAEIIDMQPLTWMDDLGDDYDQDAGWVRWDSDGDHGGSLSDNSEGDGKQTAGAYLGKYLSAVYGGIKGMQGPEVMTDGGERVEGPGEEKYEEKAADWKLAMYWATGRKIRTESRELRQAVEAEREEEEDEEDEQKAMASELISECRYEFVGAFPDHQIPDHIRRELTDIDALMQALDTPDKTGKVVGQPKQPRPTSGIPDDLEGSGMLGLVEDDGAADRGDELADDQGDGPSVAEFM